MSCNAGRLFAADPEVERRHAVPAVTLRQHLRHQPDALPSRRPAEERRLALQLGVHRTACRPGEEALAQEQRPVVADGPRRPGAPVPYSG